MGSCSARDLFGADELVVDQPKRAVGQQVEPVGHALQGNPASAARARELELALEPVLEQALDDFGRPLGFHPEHHLSKAGRHGRPKQTRAFKCGLGLRQRAQLCFDNLREQAPGCVEIRRRDPAMALALPRGEERLEDFVHKPALLHRVHHLLVFPLFVQTHHVSREKLEGAGQVGLDGAHRPGVRRLRAGGAVIGLEITGASLSTHHRPLACIGIERVELNRIDRERFFHEDSRRLPGRFFLHDGQMGALQLLQPETMAPRAPHRRT